MAPHIDFVGERLISNPELAYYGAEKNFPEVITQLASFCKDPKVKNLLESFGIKILESGERNLKSVVFGHKRLNPGSYSTPVLAFPHFYDGSDAAIYCFVLPSEKKDGLKVWTRHMTVDKDVMEEIKYEIVHGYAFAPALNQESFLEVLRSNNTLQDIQRSSQDNILNL